MIRVAAFVALFAVAVNGASADAQQTRQRIEKPAAWICALVRSQLHTLYGGDRHKAEQGARARGYTEAQIAAGKLCL